MYCFSPDVSCSKHIAYCRHTCVGQISSGENTDCNGQDIRSMHHAVELGIQSIQSIYAYKAARCMRKCCCMPQDYLNSDVSAVNMFCRANQSRKRKLIKQEHDVLSIHEYGHCMRSGQSMGPHLNNNCGVPLLDEVRVLQPSSRRRRLRQQRPEVVGV